MKHFPAIWARTLACILLMCTVLSSCMSGEAQNTKKYTAHSLDWFDTVTTVTGYEADQQTFDRISGEIFAGNSVAGVFVISLILDLVLPKKEKKA